MSPYFNGTKAVFIANSLPNRIVTYGVYHGIPIDESIDPLDPRAYNDNNPDGLGGDLSLRKLLFARFDISPEYENEFWDVVCRGADAFKRELLVRALPECPIRDIEPRESIVAYVRSPDGLGPWLDAGILDRPLLRKLSPRAYMSLSNWLRDPAHSLESEGLHIPKRVEVNSERLADPEVVLEARRISSAAYRRNLRRPGL